MIYLEMKVELRIEEYRKLMEYIVENNLYIKSKISVRSASKCTD